jgi:hypothetical protein
VGTLLTPARILVIGAITIRLGRRMAPSWRGVKSEALLMRKIRLIV